MSFFETPPFPRCISLGSSGGPSWLTDIGTVKSGMEQRNEAWEHNRHTYEVSRGVRKIEDLEELIAVFNSARGRVHGFRYKDYNDWKSCATEETIDMTDQTIGIGDGSETEFQLRKNYDFFGNQYSRLIVKPVAGSVVVAVDGIAVTGATTDTVTGVVTLPAPAASGALGDSRLCVRRSRAVRPRRTVDQSGDDSRGRCADQAD